MHICRGYTLLSKLGIYCVMYWKLSSNEEYSAHDPLIPLCAHILSRLAQHWRQSCRGPAISKRTNKGWMMRPWRTDRLRDADGRPGGHHPVVFVVKARLPCAVPQRLTPHGDRIRSDPRRPSTGLKSAKTQSILTTDRRVVSIGPGWSE